jgi:anaerobic magnesium-protoporphyrin IX monomethyl ester cyclase
LTKLKDSGCSELFIGIESGSPDILKRIHKTNDVDVIKKNLSNCLQAGIAIKGYFIFGFPEETEADFIKTYELACYLKDISIKYNTRFRTSVFQFRPYHGTELYHDIELKYGSVSNVTNVAPNKTLSELVGRLQFNFHSGNYSNESVEVVHKYIYLTTNLNSSDLFNLPK